MVQGQETYDSRYEEKDDMLQYTEKNDIFALGQMILEVMLQFEEQLRGGNKHRGDEFKWWYRNIALEEE